MELAIAAVFIFFIILILWEIKADFVLLVFGFAAYLFLLFYIVSYDPIDRFFSLVDFILLNPLELLFLIFLIGILGLYKLKKKRNSNLHS